MPTTSKKKPSPAAPAKPPRARKTKAPVAPEVSRKKRGARRKGNSYEVESAHALETIYPQARRGKEQTRNSHDAPDVVGTPWWIECKSYQGQFPARKALAQALVATTKNNGAKMRPVAFIRQTKVRPDLSVMRLEDWIELVSRAEGASAKVRALESQIAELEMELALKDDP